MTEKVRVRFAPSPTGYLHVGGARTALFNWLAARKTNGTFILRVEDTDLQRSTKEAEAGLLRDLKWLGLDWDEGPGKPGEYGPYHQSQRTKIYQEYAKKLVANGAAYPCFCKAEELDAKREKAEAEHRSLHYDGTCRAIPKEESEKRVAAGEAHVIRVRVPDKDYHVDDMVRGRVEWKSETLGDFIVLRSNGMPVYNFCVVVDDALMKITHVVRAEEHLTNSHRQLILYEALGIEPPVFAHASLILGPDKAKLSKRHGATSVGQYAEDGFLPETLINFLALLGWNEGTDQEIYTKEELIDKFSLERISKSPAVFDHTKLTWMNGQHIRNLDSAALVDLLRDRLLSAYPDDERLGREDFLTRLAEVLRLALTTLNDAVDIARPILSGGKPVDDEAGEVLADDTVPLLMQHLIDGFKTTEWIRDDLKKVIKQAGKAASVKGKKLFMPLRVKLTGMCHGPDLVGIIELLGRDEIIKRLEA